MTQIWAKTALTSEGWKTDTRLTFDEEGRILAIASDVPAGTVPQYDILLPALGNLHSHAFQRVIAGLTEARSPAGRDSFWSWRTLMYRFLEVLSPEDIEAIAAQVQMEMLEAGYASVGEFHYLHHQSGGMSYDAPEELSARVINAAQQTGIGLTHLPVYYARGGLDDRPLEGGQLRFGHTIGAFADLLDLSVQAMRTSPNDFRLGLAPHSLRAVSEEDLKVLTQLRPDDPIHIHIAEQTAEVDAVEAAYGQRPIAWLADQIGIDERWCLVHATHMSLDEIKALARSEAVAGLCPITEANLGDGIFPAPDYLALKGRFGIGSDSNVRISLSEELRTLEYSQRLGLCARNVITGDQASVGRTLYEGAARGGAQALGRGSGVIEVGAWADLVALDGYDLSLTGLKGDTLLDSWIFSGDDRAVKAVWSAGRAVVKEGQHIHRARIETRFRQTLDTLRQSL